MPLNQKESYVEIWGEDRSRGIVYGQNQDDGTGRSVRRNFNINGWEIDDTGKIIDPDYKSPEDIENELRKRAAAAALKEAATDPEMVSSVLSELAETDLLLSDRLNIKNPNQPGFLEIEDLQAELGKMNVNYHWKAGREKLLILLKEELNLSDGMENRG